MQSRRYFSNITIRQTTMDLLNGAILFIIASAIYAILHHRTSGTVDPSNFTSFNLFLAALAFIFMVWGTALGIRFFTYSSVDVYSNIRTATTITEQSIMLETKAKISKAIAGSNHEQITMMQKHLSDIEIDVILGNTGCTKFITLSDGTRVPHMPIIDWIKSSLSPSRVNALEMAPVNLWSDSTNERDAIISVRNELRSRGILIPASGPSPEKLAQGWTIYKIASMLDVKI